MDQMLADGSLPVVKQAGLLGYVLILVRWAPRRLSLFSLLSLLPTLFFSWHKLSLGSLHWPITFSVSFPLREVSGNTGKMYNLVFLEA